MKYKITVTAEADKSKNIPLAHWTKKNFFLHVRQKNLLAHIKGRFLLFQAYSYFANLFSELSVRTFYKEISKFQLKV